MCYEYDWDQRIRSAQEAIKETQKVEEELRKKPKPATPAPAPQPKDVETVPV